MIDSCIRMILDVRENRQPVMIRAKRGDTGRVLRISLSDGGVPYPITADCLAVFTARKPDGTTIFNPCTLEKNEIVYAFTEQTCACVGRMIAEIRLYGGDNKLLTSAGFLLEVGDTVWHQDDVESQEEMDALDALILETVAVKNEVEQKLANGSFIGPEGPQGVQGPAGPQGPRGEMGPEGPHGPKGETGPQGPAGDRGPEGPMGPKGEDGSISFEELTPEQMELLRGPQGIPGPAGEQGPKGDTGERGPQGPEGQPGLNGMDGVSPAVSVTDISGGHRITIQDAKGTRYIDVLDGKNGSDGQPGTQGPKGDPGATGATGPQGPQGPEGQPGKSAYQYAQDGGYAGTEEEFAEKLAADVDVGELVIKATFDESGMGTLNKTGRDVLVALSKGQNIVCEAVFADEPDYTYRIPMYKSRVEDHILTIVCVASFSSVLKLVQIVLKDNDLNAGISAFGISLQADITINNVTWNGAESIDFTDTINGMIDANVENRKLAKRAQGIFYIVGNSTTAGVWTGTSQEITEYFDGLTVAYKTNIAGVSGGSTLNINGLGAIPVKRNAETAVTTTYPAGSVILLTYSEGSWLTADYDANTKTTTGTSNKAATKLFLTGATSQTSSGTTTYSNKNCYIGKDNCLYSNDKKTVTTEDSLKNPYKLILTGAVHAEYDGSEAITVEIPSGGNAETETVLSDNLLDKSLLTSGQCFYYGSSGYQLASQTHGYYGFIPLRGAGTYRTKFQASMHSSTGTRIALCDDNNAFVVNATGTLGEVTDDNNWVDFEFVVTTAMIASGVTKVAFDVYTLFMDQTMIVKDREYPSEYIPYGYIEVATDSGKKQDNILSEKTAVFLGDSICAGTTVGTDSGYYGYGWGGIIGEANQMNWKNYGKNGGTITHRGADGTCIATIADTAISQYPTADYVIFEGGCNDADQMKEGGLGEISADYATFDTTTFSGALESMIRKILIAWPLAKVGYIIPQKMYTGYADYTAEKHIHRRYFDRAVEICKKWGIPVIDLWNNNPLNPKLPTASTFYVEENGQHLTLAGYQRITPQIEAFMRSL